MSFDTCLGCDSNNHLFIFCRYPRDLRWVGLGPGVRIYPAGPGVEWVETSVTLVRQETGFGFRIVGGTEEGSQVGSMVRRESSNALGTRQGGSIACPMFHFYVELENTLLFFV
jgi:hypothetical protein